jgi:hypothetical protein
MGEAGAEGEIGAIGRGDGGNAERVALDADRGGDGTRPFTFELGERCAQQQVKADPCRDDEQQESDRDALEELQSRATFRISMELVPPSTPDSSPLVRIT